MLAIAIEANYGKAIEKDQAIKAEALAKTTQSKLLSFFSWDTWKNWIFGG